LLDHGNAGARGQFVHGGWEIDMFVIHHEPENAPAHAAAETMKRLPLRTDVERGRFLLVKRAERFEVRARAFEREIRPDHVDDIVRGGDLLDGLRWNCHGPNGKLNRRSASWKYEDVIVNLKRGRACPANRRRCSADGTREDNFLFLSADPQFGQEERSQ